MVRDSNNSLRTAKQLGFNPFRVVERDRLGAGDRADFYRFRLDRSSFLNLSLRQFSGNANVELLDNSGSRIPIETFRGTNLDVSLSGILDKGAYFLRVFNRRTTSNYRLRVNSIEYPDDGITPPPAVTELFRSINFGRASADPSGLVVVGNFLYFAADNGVNGRGLFRTTGRGTNLTRIDINTRAPGAGSDPRDLVNVNGTLYFSATNGFDGRELYRIGSGEASVTRVADLNLGEESSDPANLINFNNVLYFTADRGSGLGRELYLTDGTSSGTRLVDDINSGADSSNPTDFAVVNNTLYFAATRDDVGRELFATNGIGSTRLVADLNFGSTDEFRNSSIPTDLINVNNVLYFAATSEFEGRELWRYDPLTNDRPQSFTNLSTGADATASASPGTDLTALSSNDPEVINTFLTNRSTQPGSNRSAFAAIGNTLYFASTSSQFGRELHRTDGTFGGTTLVSNLNIADSSNPTNLAVINNVLYFGATRSSLTGKELFRFNPAIRRPDRRLALISDIFPGSADSDPAEFVLFRNRLIFVATSGFFGREVRALIQRP